MSEKIPIEMALQMERRRKEKAHRDEMFRLQKLYRDSFSLNSPPGLAGIEAQNEESLGRFHSDVMSDGTGSMDDRGDYTSMRLSSFSDDQDNSYVVPTYDPESGQVVGDREAMQMAGPNIDSGVYRGFPNDPKGLDAEDFRRRAYKKRILRGSDFADLINPTDRAFNRIALGLGLRR